MTSLDTTNRIGCPPPLSGSIPKDSLLVRESFVGSLQNAKSLHKSRLIKKVKSLFEAILAFLRRIFCCRSSEKKSPTITQQSTSSQKLEAIPQKVLSKDPQPAVSSVPNTPSQDNKKKELLLPAFSKKPLPKPVEIVLPIPEERPPSIKASDTNTQPRATPTIFSKIGDAVVEHHLLPFFDSDSFVSLSHVSRSLSTTVLKSQKTLYLPGQLDLITEENRELLKKVETFSLSFEAIDNDQSKKLADKVKAGFFPKVKSIQIEQNIPLEPRPWMGWATSNKIDDGLVSLIEVLPHLEHFNLIAGKEIKDWNKNAVSQTVLLALSEHCPNLRTLNQHWNLEESSYEFIQRLTKKWQNLETFYFTNMHDRYASFLLRSIVKNCPGLKRIDLSHNNIFDHDVQLLAQNCPLLESLTLDNAKRISPESFQALAEGCPNLRELSYYASGTPYDVVKRNNYVEDLHPLTQNCRDIESLHLAFTTMTELGMQVLRSWKLRKLTLFECSGLNSSQIGEILTNQPNLEELDIRCNFGLNTPVILAQPHRLKSLDLWTVKNLTDENFIPLLSMLPELECLDISGYSKKLTDKFLEAIEKHCPKLTTLTIADDSTNFSQNALNHLQEANKNLRIIEGKI